MFWSQRELEEDCTVSPPLLQRLGGEGMGNTSSNRLSRHSKSDQVEEDDDELLCYSTISLDSAGLFPDKKYDSKRKSLQPPIWVDSEEYSARLHQIIRKIDWKIMPIVWLIQCFNVLTRISIANASIIISIWGDLKKDLSLSHAQYALAMSVFFITYISFEVPSNVILKRWTPSKWIGILLTLVALVAGAFALMRDYPTFLTLRLLLGAFQAGIFPGIVYYLSYWYHNHELATRMAIMTSSVALSAALGGLLGFCMSHLDGWYDFPGWRMLFFVEAIPTLILGIVTFFIMPDYPHSAPFLDEDERAIASFRASNSCLKSKNEHSFDIKEFWRTLFDVQIWAYMLLLNAALTPTYGLALSMPSIVQSMGFKPSVSQILSIPYAVVGSITSVILGIRSDIVKDRFWTLLTTFSIAILCFFTLIFVQNNVVQFILIIVANSALSPAIPIILTWLSNNTLGSTRKSVATALVISFGNAGGIWGAHIYFPSDAPFYPSGHLIMMGFCVLGVMVVIGLKLTYRLINRKRDALYGFPEIKDRSAFADGEQNVNFRYQE